MQPTLPSHPRILLIRRNRIGDMICAVPLLKALRRAFPQSFIRVLCEETGAPIARASRAADDVCVLHAGINRWHALWKNRRALRGFDMAIGVKGGFDRRLAWMIQCSGAPVRIGFVRAAVARSFFYSHPLPPPPPDEHQIETCLRLIEPIGILHPPIDISLQWPPDAIHYADRLAADRLSDKQRKLFVMNISSTQGAVWPLECWAELARRLLAEHAAAVAIAHAPRDKNTACEMARKINTPHCFELDTPDILHLGAVLSRAAALITPEGGAAHLAAAVPVPAVVLWKPGGTIDKWKSRCDQHVHLMPRQGLEYLTVDEVLNSVIQISDNK